MTHEKTQSKPVEAIRVVMGFAVGLSVLAALAGVLVAIVEGLR